MKKFLLVLSVCFIAFGQVLAQSQTISGTVRNAADDEPIIGASVQVKGTSKGTITDIDGKFSLSVDPNSVLVVSFIGMSTQEVAAKDGVVINLSEDTEVLDEVMVIGYGTTTRAQFVGSAEAVSGDDLTKQAQSNVTNALQGKMTGVQVVNTNGQPGTSASIRIRGTGSINGGTDPLYIVDGAPYEGSINSISSYDIASITVLKDAAATAIYGARGANGVILITTKSGSANTKFEVNLDAKWGTNQRAVPNYNVMRDPGMYMETAYKALYNTRIFSGATPAEAYAFADATLFESNGGVGYQVYTVPAGERLVGTNFKLNPHATLGYSDGQYYYTPDNWEANTLNTKNLRHEYNININGGNADSQFFLSAGYLSDPGIIGGSSFERYTIRGRVDSQVKKWLKVGGSFSYAHTTTENPGYQGAGSAGSTANMFSTITLIAPIYPFFVRNADGSIKKDERGYTVYDKGSTTNQTRPGTVQGNHAINFNIDQHRVVGDNFSGNVYLTLTPVEGLNLTARVAPSVFNYRSNDLNNPFYNAITEKGQVAVEHDRAFSLDQQYLASYKHRFAQEHNLEVLLGWESYWYRSQSLYAQNDHLFNPFIAELSNAYGEQPTSGNVSSSQLDFKTAGLMARVQYDLKDRYFLNATYRFEGSSRFSPKNRWGHFGSIGAAWMISNEDFMDGVKDVDQLKLKASWGTQGNDQIGTGVYSFITYQDFYTISYNASTGEFSKVLYIKGNPDLTWEKQMLSNVGLEFDFLKNRLGGSVEYFNRTNKDMLFSLAMPPSAGFGSLRQNVGTVANNGLEIELYGTLVKTRNIEWEVNFNLTYIKSKVVALPDVYKENGWVSGASIIREGGSLIEGYMVMYAGVDKATGQALYYADPEAEKAAGNFDKSTWATTANIESAKQADIGDLAIKGYGGFGTTFKAYGIDLSIQCAYQFGGQAFDGTYQRLMHTGKYLGQNWHMDILNAWTPENTETNVPRLCTTDDYNQEQSDRWLISNDYLSLNNITVGYTLPKKWTKKAQIEKVRIYFQGDNLALWSKRKGFDPRQAQNADAVGLTSPYYTGSTAYSQLRTLSGGISITF